MYLDNTLVDKQLVSETVARRCFCEEGVHKVFAKFTGTTSELFLIKLQAWSLTQQVFSCESYEIFDSTFFIEHFLWLVLLVCCRNSFLKMNLRPNWYSWNCFNAFAVEKWICCLGFFSDEFRLFIKLQCLLVVLQFSSIL